MVDSTSGVGSTQPVTYQPQHTDINQAPGADSGQPLDKPKNTTTMQSFETYLNNQQIANETTDKPNTVFDPAADISKNSVYLPPGQFTPT